MNYHTPIENTQLAQAIDHTKLTFAPDEDEQTAILQLCDEAKSAGFYAVCVRPQHIQWAKQGLQGTKIKVAAVIGFPPQKVSLKNELKQPTIGDFSCADKVAEAQKALEVGADELDWVIRVADLKEDVQTGTKKVYEELKAAHQTASQIPIKIIIETDLLAPEEIIAVSKWSGALGMAMVKTSTGMVEGGKGATLEAVRLILDTLKQTGASHTGIKASGGIKTRAQAQSFLNLGVSRLGTSSGLSILNQTEACSTGSY